VPAAYNHREVVEHIVQRVASENASFGTIVLDTHNDQDYPDPEHHASANLELILSAIRTACEEMSLRPVGATLESMCRLVLPAEAA
jgi:hypothetical protein